MTLAVEGLAEAQEPTATEVMGPSKSIAVDAQGKPTKAAIGFAAAQGVEIERLKRELERSLDEWGKATDSVDTLAARKP